MCEPIAIAATTDSAEEWVISDTFDDIVFTEERINGEAYE